MILCVVSEEIYLAYFERLVGIIPPTNTKYNEWILSNGIFADDGTFYFDEKHVDAAEYKGPITTSASVVRGVTSFAAVASGKLNVSFLASIL